MEAFRLMKELKVNLEQESQYLPKESGLKLIESNPEVKLTDPRARAHTHPSFGTRAQRYFILKIVLIRNHKTRISLQLKLPDRLLEIYAI